MLELLRRHRDFRLLWIAVVISFLGDWFATVALLGIVHDLTESALATTFVLVCQTLPTFLMTVWAGPVADRFDRRRVMATVSMLQVVAALGFLLISDGRVWIAFVAQALISALAAFFGPASGAALPNLVPPEDLGRAGSIMGSTWGAMLAIGAGLGGVFTALFGRTAAFVADAASFAIAAALVALIVTPTSRATTRRARLRPVHDTREALQRARRDPVLLALLLSKTGFGLGAGVVGLLAVLATRRFDGADATTGLLLGVRGAGALLGPIIAERRGATRSPSTILTACAVASILYGASYLVVAWSSVLVVCAVFVFIAHMGGGAQWTMSTIGLQMVAPDEMRGRILAADFALVMVTMAASTALAGWAADRFSVSTVMAVLAMISIAWGVAYSVIGRRLHRGEPTPA